jgi:hypothetical protein
MLHRIAESDQPSSQTTDVISQLFPPPDQGEVRWGLAAFSEDLFEYAIEIFQDIVVPKALDALSPLRNQAGALLVLGHVRKIGVLRAIKLDYEVTIPAAEINDKVTDWKLTTKLEAAKLTSANAVPELLFSGNRITAEHPCNLMNLLAA